MPDYLITSLPGVHQCGRRLKSGSVSHSAPEPGFARPERADALLSLAELDDILLTAWVGLSGSETMGHLHDLINTVARGVTSELDYAGTTIAATMGVQMAE